MRSSLISTLFTGWLLAVWAGAPPAIAAQGTEVVGLAGKCLDVLGSSTAEGAKVVLFGCRGTASQRWDLPARGFAGEIVGLGGKCLDIRGGVAQNRARAEMRSCDGQPTQQWRFGQDGRIVGADGLCLDVLQSNTADLARIVVFDCHGKGNQLWRPREEGRFTLTPLETEALVVDLQIDPGDPKILFVRNDDAGLFRSEDGGESWSPLYEGFEPPSVDVRLESLDRGANRVLYAQRSYDQYLRSTNGGRSWQELNNDFFISSLAADGRRASQVYAATGDGRIFLSGDTGRNWQLRSQLPDPQATGVCLFTVPGRSDHLIASSLHYSGTTHCVPDGIFLSLDGGRSWQITLRDTALEEVKVDPHNLDHLLARTTFCTLLRSLNGGASWTEVRPPGVFDIQSVVIDPRQPGRALVGADGEAYLSEDFGDSWSLFPVPIEREDLSELRFLAISEEGTLFVSFYNLYQSDPGRYGLYRSDDFGQSWSKIGRGLTNASVFGVTTTVGRPEVYAYGEDGLFVAVDGGTRWRRLRSGDQTSMAVDPFDANHLIAAEIDGSLSASTDGGKSFHRVIARNDSLIVAAVFDPKVRGRLFTLTSDGSRYQVDRSDDGGASRQLVLEGESFSLQLEIGPDGRIYVAQDQGVQVSDDAGVSWRLAEPACESCCGLRIAVDRSIAGRVWVNSFSQLWRSDDGGSSWQEIQLPTLSGGDHIYYIYGPVAGEGQVFFRQDDGGVWRSSDGGASWSLLAAGMPVEVSTGLAIDGVTPGRIWAAASGLGVLVGDFND